MIVKKIIKTLVKKNAKTPSNESIVNKRNGSSWWAKLNPKQQKLISNIAIGLGISVLAATVIYFTNRFIKNKIANREQGKSFGDDIHATWANQIHNAIINDGLFFGTDVVALRKALIEIPSKQDFEKVKKSYNRQFKGANMSVDIRGDLSTTEYNEMLAIINSKPEKSKDGGVPIYDPIGWAKRLNAAVNYQTWGFMWGTDADAITAVIIEMPTQQAFADTAEVYLEIFGVSLMTDLTGDLSIYEIIEYTKLVKRKPIK